jgi:hypothetical protein
LYLEDRSDNVFTIRYSPELLPLFLLFGLGPKQSCVQVGQDSISVTMGWGFRATIPRQNVRAIMPDGGSVWGWGVHGWHGTWLVNGLSAGLVRLELEPGVRAWVMGVPVRLKVLRLSLNAPDELMSLLRRTR